MTITTQDCKSFLQAATLLKASSLPVAARVEALYGAPLGEWARVRKYKNAAGQVARDFVNKTAPVVVTLVEDGGAVKLSRERPIFLWEEKLVEPFEDHILEDIDDEYEDIVWEVALPEDFCFCVCDGNGEPIDPDVEEGKGYVFGFNVDNSYDQSIRIEKVVERTGSPLKLWETMEQHYEQTPAGTMTTKEIKIELERLGFRYNPDLIDG